MLQLFVGNFESCESWKTWIRKTGWTFNEFSVFHYLVGNHQPHLKNGFSTRDARKFQVSGWRWKNKTRMINQTPGKVKPERRLHWEDFNNRFQRSNQTTNNNQLLQQLFEIHALKLTAQPVEIGHPKETFISSNRSFSRCKLLLWDPEISPTQWREAREAQARLVKMTLGGAGFPENFPMVFKGDGRNLMDWLATKGTNPRKHHGDIYLFLHLKQWEMDGGFTDFWWIFKEL